jgi:hypothetical protein
VQKQRIAAWMKDLKVEELDCGHWIQLEKLERSLPRGWRSFRARLIVLHM